MSCPGGHGGSSVVDAGVVSLSSVVSSAVVPGPVGSSVVESLEEVVGAVVALGSAIVAPEDDVVGPTKSGLSSRQPSVTSAKSHARWAPLVVRPCAGRGSCLDRTERSIARLGARGQGTHVFKSMSK